MARQRSTHQGKASAAGCTHMDNGGVRLLDDLLRALMDAYDALPVQEQEGPLGDQITILVQEGHRFLHDRERQPEEETRGRARGDCLTMPIWRV
jgi:hypothetical protein